MTWTDHLVHVRAVLQKLLDSGLTAKPSKIFAGFRELEFLGHVVGRGVVKPHQDKLNKILSIPTPTTKRQVRSLLGLIGYYRRFVAGFSSVTAPISDLLRTGSTRQIVWTTACADALTSVQRALSSNPVLLLADPELPFVLQTDASSTGVGAVLLQYTEDEHLHPIAFASRKLLDRETRYSVIERECLAIVWAVSKFSRYLWGKTFRLQTDHRPLTYIGSGKYRNARIMRWVLALQEYSFEIDSLPGTQNTFADLLSRSECEQMIP